MRTLVIFSLVAALLSLIIAAAALLQKNTAAEEVAPPASARGDSSRELSELRDELARLKAIIGNGQPAEESNTSAPSVADRLVRIEASLAKLESSFNGISLEESSAERDELFKAENGNLKADEYLAAGKFAIAGEGYLTFLAEHPDHPDARDILKQARTAFQGAGYSDKALWVQTEMMKTFPEFAEGDMMDLAKMEKAAGRYSDAVKHAAEAAELATDPADKLWRKMYWAWYNQLDSGNQAGLAAYRSVEAEIAEAGFSDDRIGERVRKKIAEIENVTAAK